MSHDPGHNVSIRQPKANKKGAGGGRGRHEQSKKLLGGTVLPRLAGAITPNRSQQGADCQAVLMSVFPTLKQRGHDPIQTIVDALTDYLTTRQLPPLPEQQTTSDG